MMWHCTNIRRPSVNERARLVGEELHGINRTEQGHARPPMDGGHTQTANTLCIGFLLGLYAAAF